MSLTTKDAEQAKNFIDALGLTVSIGMKSSGSSSEKKYYHIQFGDVLFYGFLKSIGLTPAKSRTIGALQIPDDYFFDFLRGHYDGDGTFYSYFDPRWRSSFMFYTVFVSASIKHICWLQEQISKRIGVHGHITGKNAKGIAYQLKYAKAESLQLLPKMYYDKQAICLSRKRDKIRKAVPFLQI
ncbi:MAG: hypothetical protein AAB420_04450 [Patescibacteria group bacterium]